MENLSVEQLQAALRPFRRMATPKVRENLKRLGHDWRNGLPVTEIETFARRFVFERHQEAFIDAATPEPPAPKKKAKRKKAPAK